MESLGRCRHGDVILSIGRFKGHLRTGPGHSRTLWYKMHLSMFSMNQYYVHTIVFLRTCGRAGEKGKTWIIRVDVRRLLHRPGPMKRQAKYLPDKFTYTIYLTKLFASCPGIKGYSLGRMTGSSVDDRQPLDHTPGSCSSHHPTNAKIGDTERFELFLIHLPFVGTLFLSRLDWEPVRHEVEQPIVDVGYAMHERRRTRDATRVLTWVCLQDRR